MLQLNCHTRHLLYNGCVDMRKSFAGHLTIVSKDMKADVQTGDVYVFLSNRRNAIKLLRFEGDGFAIFCKRLEQNTFEMPGYPHRNNTIMVTDEEPFLIVRCGAEKNKMQATLFTAKGG